MKRIQVVVTSNGIGLAIATELANLSLTSDLAKGIIQYLEAKDDLFIPQYEEVFKQVLQRYHEDFRKE